MRFAAASAKRVLVIQLGGIAAFVQALASPSFLQLACARSFDLS
jgi:hypothetical protein